MNQPIIIMKQQHQQQHGITIDLRPIEGWQFNYCTGIPLQGDGSSGVWWLIMYILKQIQWIWNDMILRFEYWIQQPIRYDTIQSNFHSHVDSSYFISHLCFKFLQMGFQFTPPSPYAFPIQPSPNSNTSWRSNGKTKIEMCFNFWSNRHCCSSFFS
jgi:hypothetical protein